MSLDKNFHNDLEKIKTNYQNEAQKVLNQRIELELIPESQFIYTADFFFENQLFVGCFPISIYNNPYGGFLGGKKIPLPGVITIGSVIEGTIPTSIITKTVKTGFASHKRVFFPCLSELLDPSKGSFKIEPKTIYKERRGFADNPLVELLNEDNWLIERIQKIPDQTYKSLDWSGKRSISNRICDGKKDLVTLGQVVPYKKMTLVAFQCMPDWQKGSILLDCTVGVAKRISEHIKKYGSFEEKTGVIVQPWISAFLQVFLFHLKTHKQNLPETEKILQNFTA